VIPSTSIARNLKPENSSLHDAWERLFSCLRPSTFATELKKLGKGPNGTCSGICQSIQLWFQFINVTYSYVGEKGHDLVWRDCSESSSRGYSSPMRSYVALPSAIREGVSKALRSYTGLYLR
jgi:hypothetical protein